MQEMMRMGVRRFAWATVLCAASAGCSRTAFLYPQDYVDLGEETWARYVADLDLPPCPRAQELVVDTTTVELDGGIEIARASDAGERLSLVEALWIASNRAANDGLPTTVRFDAGVFPPTLPQAIHLSAGVGFPWSEQLCLDGRGAGVVIAWDDSAGLSRDIWGLGTGSRQIGLTLLGVPYEQTLHGAEVAGCRYDTDGVAAFNTGSRPWCVEVTDSVLGPGNVFAGSRVRTWRDAVVRGNSFGTDPVTGYDLELPYALDVENDLLAEHNEFVVAQAVSTSGLEWAPDGPVVLRNNNLRRNPLVTFPAGMAMAVHLHNMTGVVGPGNTIAGFDGAAIALNGSARAHITQNSLVNNTAAISDASNAPLVPPTIVSAASGLASGTCATPGTVEVFSDATADSAETYLGSAACDGSLTWSLAFAPSVPMGRYLTATLTDAAPRTSALSAPVLVSP